MNEQSALVYYATQAANRRHFQLLFFAVVGFTWCFALAVFVVLEPRIGHSSMTASGLVLVGGAFIAQRLLRRERASFEAMLTAWRTLSPPTEPLRSPGGMPGAMAIACGAQALLGCALVFGNVVR